ncbi:PREDICTED: uncharacterized protein LOC105557563 isoform X2 [Vollenhovia emeryi]|uniref:uncharacterized protein LOC105557563 isoform X2 n=1 Tax=Vollenhovia emeryi TaxID=411798 RepID=UPI0005F3C6C8|nr:PREDICTED: uncharacterized protein LOC105557563 isoform X2 [Vollenhovia emeryi]
MFPKNVKTTLLCGPKELSKSFMFEAATYWAEEGQRVVYITPMPLERRPAACHDRRDPTVVALKLMRFIYLQDYKALVEQLFQLHTYAAVPSVLLIDLDDYPDGLEAAGNDSSMHVARICALILHAMKSCSRILKKNVHVCAWTSSSLINNPIQTIYFRNIWSLTENEDGTVITVEKISIRSPVEQSYVYHKFEDGMRILQQVLCDSAEA